MRLSLKANKKLNKRFHLVKVFFGIVLICCVGAVQAGGCYYNGNAYSVWAYEIINGKRHQCRPDGKWRPV